MAEEAVEEITEEAPAEVAEEAPAEEETEQAADSEEAPKTLLSGDEGTEEDGVPDEYTFEAPEGAEVNEEALAQFADTAKELKLSQAQYQSLIEYDMQRQAEAVQAMSDQYSNRVASWAEEAKADKVIGGEALDENLGLAKRAIETFGDDDLAQIMSAPSADNPDGLGLGNHPAMIRLFYRVGKSISESNLVTGDSKVEGPSALERMYPSMFQQAG
tara:strand:- start:2866 stop:3513 length:648 start_codon:yes stop_codon:yes gene_type:complete